MPGVARVFLALILVIVFIAAVAFWIYSMFQFLDSWNDVVWYLGYAVSSAIWWNIVKWAVKEL